MRSFVVRLPRYEIHVYGGIHYWHQTAIMDDHKAVLESGQRMMDQLRPDYTSFRSRDPLRKRTG